MDYLYITGALVPGSMAGMPGLAGMMRPPGGAAALLPGQQHDAATMQAAG